MGQRSDGGSIRHGLSYFWKPIAPLNTRNFMFYITQLIYLKPGGEADFEAFEAQAIPLLAQYAGRLLLRLRPNEAAVIAGEMEVPYEVHFVSFESREDFERFAKDDSRKAFLHLKEASVREVWMIGGARL